MSDRIIGLFYIIENITTCPVYPDMLQNFVFSQIAEVDGLIFQLDDAPPHFGAIARAALNSHFPGRWNGRAGPISWPSPSPNLTPMILFLWGFVKDIVCRENV
jgi:hypothetical protein